MGSGWFQEGDKAGRSEGGLQGPRGWEKGEVSRGVQGGRGFCARRVSREGHPDPGRPEAEVNSQPAGLDMQGERLLSLLRRRPGLV